MAAETAVASAYRWLMTPIPEFNEELDRALEEEFKTTMTECFAQLDEGSLSHEDACRVLCEEERQCAEIWGSEAGH